MLTVYTNITLPPQTHITLPYADYVSDIIPALTIRLTG